MTPKPDQPLLTVHNTHHACCGTPPALSDPTYGTYFGYFRGSCGDQFLLEVNVVNKTGVLRSGDMGWENDIPIADNAIDGGILPSREEVEWLRACWFAAT